MVSPMDSTKYLNYKLLILYILIQKIEAKVIIPNSCCEAIALGQKYIKGITTKENYRPASLKNIEAKILKKYLKSNSTVVAMNYTVQISDIYPGLHGLFNINLPYQHTNESKQHDHINQWREIISQNPFMIKTVSNYEAEENSS